MSQKPEKNTTSTTMYTSIRLSHFLALFLGIVFPLYLATCTPGSLLDVALFLSNLSKRAEALHVALTSPLATPSASVSQAAVEASARSAKLARAPEGGKKLPNGLAHAINSFEQYPSLADRVLQRKHARYSKQTPAQKLISNKLGYPAHFDKARQGINVNARLSEQIVQVARERYHTGPQALEDDDDAEFGLVDLAFGHLSRDWSAQGTEERHTVFPPLLAGLEQHFGGHGGGKKVLVPGSGMGRLASDIADLGASHLSSGVEGVASGAHTWTQGTM
jgi:hypothetical protein